MSAHSEYEGAAHAYDRAMKGTDDTARHLAREAMHRALEAWMDESRRAA